MVRQAFFASDATRESCSYDGNLVRISQSLDGFSSPSLCVTVKSKARPEAWPYFCATGIPCNVQVAVEVRVVNNQLVGVNSDNRA